MSNPSFKDLLSKSLQEDLKQMTKASTKPEMASDKPNETVNLPSSKAILHEVKRFNHDAINDDTVLFMQAMSGVIPLKTDAVVSHTKPTQTDENMLRRRASAEGDEPIKGVLSDMQALLNPVASEAFLSYKNPTLQNKVFEQLKQGKLRWYDAVDLHGSSIDDARKAVLLLISQAINHGETVVKMYTAKVKMPFLKPALMAGYAKCQRSWRLFLHLLKTGAMVQYWYYSKKSSNSKGCICDCDHLTIK